MISNYVVSLELADEEWRDVEGYEGLYRTSNHGSVLSLGRGGTPGGLLKLYKSEYGYWKISLTKNNKQKTLSVHRLVAYHFIGKPTPFAVVNHKDGNRTNNYYKNLEWVDRKHNNLHAFVVLGRSNAGGKNPKAKLTNREVRFIRWLQYKYPNIKSGDIARFYGMTNSAINEILTFKNWNKE